MKILEVCVDLDGGGIDRYLYNYCTRIDDEIHFDFVVVDNREGILEPLLEERGSKIYRVPRITDGIFRNFIEMKRIMKSNRYDAVHVHLGYKSFIALFAAWLCGIRTRITHAHIAFVPESKMAYYARKVFTLLTRILSTDLAACGIDAAKWVWGDKAYNANLVQIINNAIDTKAFLYSEDTRKQYRKELSIADEVFIVGHVGRLCDQKNQLRLLEIFGCLQKKNENSLLLLIGQGEMEEEVRKRVEILGLDKKVMFLGIRNDVAALLNVMDVFIFPSKYEGLPFTLIETQSNGLPSISADSVTRYVKVSNCLCFMSLDETNETWAEKALHVANKGRSTTANQQVIENGYDIDAEAQKLKQYYYSCVEGK